MVSRLCEPIEGLGAASIAEFLGLDPSRYRTSSGGQEEENGGGLGGQTGEKRDPFDGVSLPTVLCQHCHKCVIVLGTKASERTVNSIL